MNIRPAEPVDLPAIVAIYNASIPGRMATADLHPVTVEQRKAWFAEFHPARRPLWVAVPERRAKPVGWLSLRSFYGRPAYHATVEVAVYVDPAVQRSGIAAALLQHAIAAAPSLRIKTLLAFVFGHNTPSIRLFERFGFVGMGWLPGIAELDGIERDLAILGLRIASAPGPVHESAP